MGGRMPHTSAPWMTLHHTTANSVQSCRVVVSAITHRIRNRITGCLRDLAVDYQLVDQERLDIRGHVGTLFVLDCGVVERLSRCPARTIVVFADCPCPLSVLHHVVAGRVVPLRYEGLDPKKMCRAIIRCVATNGVGGLAAHLNSHDAFAGVPRRILSAFVLHPERLRSLSDVCRVLAVSPDSARALVRRAGYRRSEHLFVRLRVESWVWFFREGFRPSVFESYLGIRDRSDFRRACRRAGLELPWYRVD